MSDNWISVDNQLPAEGEDVLVWVDGGYGLARGWLAKGKGQLFWMVDGERRWGDLVTHWQPLPSAPQGVQRAD